jgi:TolB-like protein/DNA-binding SARP family transcriptional activator/TPR repeat protein
VFQLRVLGGLRLEGASGPITGRAAQRKRLAVLTRLALARGTPLTRDSLCGLLWGESSDEQAHQSLSAALYDLRRVVGEAALPAVGEDLRLDPSAVQCYALSFQQAAEGERLEEALSLYAGPLLEGVFFGGEGKEEWEKWVDAERARLARLYREVLGRLADQREAAGDPAGALDLLQRLVREDPFGARGVLRLMGALTRSGERARAIQVARLYAERVRSELEAEPDSAVLALVDQLRRAPPLPQAEPALQPVAEQGPAPESGRTDHKPAQPRLSRAAVLVATSALLLGCIGGFALYRARFARADDAAPIIAVLPFENLTRDKDNEYFVDGISDDLLTRLARVPRLRVISRISVQRYKHTTKSIKEIGRELGATHVLEGSIRRAGDTVRINAQLIDAHKDRHVWAERYDRSLREVFHVQTEISVAIAAALVAALRPEQRALLATGGTTDPLAYDLYLRGQQYADRNSFDSATASLRRAAAVDPGYALAHAALAWMYARGSPERPAWRDSATAEARRALELDPRSTTARRALAELYIDIGRPADAEKLLRTTLEIDPNDTEAMTLLSLSLGLLGRVREAADLRAATLRLDPMNAKALYQLGWMFEKNGDLSLAIRAERRAMELGYVPAYALAAQFCLWQGDFAAAREIAAEARDVLPGGEFVSNSILAEVAARAGDWEEAEQRIKRPFGVSSETHLFPAYVAIKRGKRARADSLLTAYEQELNQRKAAGFSVLTARMRVAALRGDREGAVALLRQARAEGYGHCLPRPTLYLESLEGYPPYEAIREEMCAEGRRNRAELERTGTWADLVRIVAPGGVARRPYAPITNPAA